MKKVTKKEIKEKTQCSQVDGAFSSYKYMAIIKDQVFMCMTGDYITDDENNLIGYQVWTKKDFIDCIYSYLNS